MLVSTRGRYAIRIMLELGNQNTINPEKRISLAELSEKQEISLKYAEAIVAMLVKNGFLDGLRGKFGGYRLGMPAERIKIGEILKLTEESLAPVACLDCSPNQCAKASTCKTLPMWTHLNNLINDYLNSVTLKDLIEGKNEW